MYSYACNNVFSQDKWWKEQKYKSENIAEKFAQCKKTFTDVSIGLNRANINFINLYFDTEVYLNIITNEKGYYSSNQAELMLIDFMEYFRVISFNYTRSHRKNMYAFATGKYVYNRGSGSRFLDVTVSLKYRYDKWLIDQISIN